METSIWAHREGTGYRPRTDLAGFEVEATDGRIGKVDKHSYEADSGHLIVDTGTWIFGKQVLLPVGIIALVDPVEHVVHVDRSREEIKLAPKYDNDPRMSVAEYRQQLGAYYLMRRWP